MPEYIFSHRIDTMLSIYDSFEFDDFTFSNWELDGVFRTDEYWQDGWVATKKITAETINDAYREFFSKFHPLVDRIAVIGQCYTWTDFQPLIITKEGDTLFYCRFSRPRGSPGLNFGDQEIASLSALSGYEPPGDAFRYLRESNNAITADTRLAMLVSALEGFAGAEETKRGPRTKREYISDVILENPELCQRIFGYGDGIRNQILHGRYIDLDLHGGTSYTEEIYGCVIEYLNSQHGTNISMSAVGVPRHHAGDFEVWEGYQDWLKEDEILTLQLFQKKFDAQDSPQYFKSASVPDGY